MTAEVSKATNPRINESTDPLLSVHSLTVSYPTQRGAHLALRNFSLSIRPGEVVGLVGESGSGKTTLARAIMGLLPRPGRIVEGDVVFNGQSLLKKTPEELQKIRGRELAMVVPNPRAELNPLLPVGRQITNVIETHLGVSHREAKQMALKMLEDVRIPDPARRFHAYPHELSGGMAQRVVMAIALACSPKFVISDDATSGLDVTIQAQILQLLRQLVEEYNTSMLFITRDIGIVAHFCHRVAVIYHGELVEIASHTDFFANPQHPYSVMLLAAFSHNPVLRRQWMVKHPTAVTVEKFDPSQGCPFASRCVEAREHCYRETPTLRETSPGHWVRCHFPVER